MTNSPGTDLATALDDRRNAEFRIESAVIALRRINTSWQDVGCMLGVSKQAAQKKYAPICRAVERDHDEAAAVPAQLEGQTAIDVIPATVPAAEQAAEPQTARTADQTTATAAGTATESGPHQGMTATTTIDATAPADFGRPLFYTCTHEACSWEITMRVPAVNQWHVVEQHEIRHELEDGISRPDVAAMLDDKWKMGRGNCDDLGNVTRTFIDGSTIRQSVYGKTIPKCGYCGTSDHYSPESGYWMYERCDTTTKDKRHYKTGDR